jgi:hypothetical protein
MIIILGFLIARGSEHEHGLWFGRGLLLYFLALGAGIHGGFGWVGLRGLPLFAKIFFCLEGKYNLCTKLKNKLGERSATRFRLCKSMFVGVYLDDVVALVALPWGVFTVSVGKEEVSCARTSGSWWFLIFPWIWIEERQPLGTLKLQSFKPMVEAVAASTDGIIATII